MSTQTVIDIAALVGELEDNHCEHSSHLSQSRYHSDEAASHYYQFRCDCGHVSDVITVCPGYVRTCQSGTYLRCSQCGDIAPASESGRILGPVNK